MEEETATMNLNPILENLEKLIKPKVPKPTKATKHIGELPKSIPTPATTTVVVEEPKPTLDEKFEKAVKFLEDYSIPWFLKSSELYITTKKTITGITVDDKTKAFIENFTTYLKDSSMTLIKAVKPMLTEDDVKSLILQIDELLLKYLTFFDACVDQTKLNIASLLRTFKNAILEHAEKFRIIATKQIENAKVVSGQVITTVNTSVDKSVVYVKDNYPLVADKAQLSLEILNKTRSFLIAQFEAYFKLLREWLQQSTNMAKLTYQKSVDTSVVVTHSVLQTAQPYVKQAVSISQPYFVQAVEVCTHEPVKGYLQPMVVSATTVKEALEKNPVAGPYVEVGKKAFETVKTYCTEDTAKASASTAVIASN